MLDLFKIIEVNFRFEVLEPKTNFVYKCPSFGVSRVICVFNETFGTLKKEMS